MSKQLTDMSPAELHAAEPQALARLAEHFGTLPRVQLDLDPGAAWMLVGALQLVLRHPQLPANTRQHVRGLVDALIGSLSNGDVEIALLMKRGGEAAYDRPIDVPTESEKRNP